MKFEIVNHCHNYSRLLSYQLSSLVLYPPVGHEIVYTLYYEASDDAVMDTAVFFRDRLPYNVTLRFRPQPLDTLRNRANGRDEAALATTADWVWFTDTDYMFLRKCWSDLYEQLVGKPDTRFATPLTLYETDWPTGDKLIADMSDGPRVADVDLTAIPVVSKHIAIGGIQIAHGPTVRQIGYCGWMRGPRSHWDFKSDVRFRRQPEMSPKLDVKLDAVLRIRHSQRGYGQADWEGVRN